MLTFALGIVCQLFSFHGFLVKEYSHILTLSVLYFAVGCISGNNHPPTDETCCCTCDASNHLVFIYSYHTKCSLSTTQLSPQGTDIVMMFTCIKGRDVIVKMYEMTMNRY